MIQRELKLVVWYLERPRLYPQLLYAARKKFLSSLIHPADTRQEAEAWCRARAVPTEAALAQITGSPMPESVRSRFPAVFVVAEQTARACPVKMGGAGNLDLLYWLAEYCQATTVIETGVAYGWSSLALLLSLSTRPGARLLSTDMPYPNANNEQFVGCVVPQSLRSGWQIIDRADRQALPRALQQAGRIDMCHYDSDKSYAGRMWAYPRLWKALRKGGIFISDDIGDNLAFRDFAEAVKADPILVAMEDKYMGLMVKQGDAA